MSEPKVRRRDVLLGAGVAGVSVAGGALQAQTAAAQIATHQPTVAATVAALQTPAYVFLKPTEQAFVEAMVDHMIPADELTASGTDLGISVYIDRACSGAWGQGDKLYMDGPWKPGTANQGYQLPLTPAELYRQGIAGSNAYCRKTYGKAFDKLTAEQKEAFLKDLSGGKIMLDGAIPGRTFFDQAYQTVMEGMFADPIYGGNRGMAGWKMVGFPGVVANNAENIKTYNDGTVFRIEPLSIADMS